MPLNAYFIQYKFIIPKSLSRSSYTYQKLFRALYGYTQAVYKSTGKTYKYHRKGILSDVPFLRPSKNSVIIPTDSLQKLINFFNTGENPAHRWIRKGEWKAVYYMNEKTISEQNAAKAVENMIDRQWVDFDKEKRPLVEELSNIASGKGETIYAQKILAACQKIVSHDWFLKGMPYSEKLTNFKKLYDAAMSSLGVQIKR